MEEEHSKDHQSLESSSQPIDFEAEEIHPSPEAFFGSTLLFRRRGRSLIKAPLPIIDRVMNARLGQKLELILNSFVENR